MIEQKSYYNYWGKARTELEIDYRSGKLSDAAICRKYKISQEKLDKDVKHHRWVKIAEGERLFVGHLFPYHCLDVAAVADGWWDASSALQKLFVESTGLHPSQVKAWLLFFIGLHDYGKIDMRFQLKAPRIVEVVYPDFDPELVDIDSVAIKGYFHGTHGFSLFYYDFQSLFLWNEDDRELWSAWQPWLAAVAGHHGVIPQSPDAKNGVELDEKHQADLSVIEHDRTARMEWVSALESLFLKPAGFSIQDIPPSFNPLVAGFCSVVDWLGSNSEEGAFEFKTNQEPLDHYYRQRLSIAGKQLVESGLVSNKKSYQGVSALLPKEGGATPRQLQLLVDQLPIEQGLTLIEAPTGSGKTEIALAYAWRLLDAGLADSIIFALPTQATANAMLKRLEDIAPLLFQNQPNLVLAHGKAAFNDDFWKIKESYRARTEQGSEEAKVQCAQWLSSSRKRVFLGQIGVCTIDQVLISVLPVRHKFVRGFGVGKSILIVDEVHAYDSYMYGLLGEVLRQQQRMGGSALLLSATLPYHQRSALSKTWGGDLSEDKNEPYPLVAHINRNGVITPFTLNENELPKERIVGIEVIAKPALLADDALIEQMIQAAAQGAQVVFICNLVDVAQSLAKRLRAQSDVPVDLFHARYRFCDRQTVERDVLKKYGKGGKRESGAILIATQVVEQSLDLDFDWMITQLCPVDLLFQRLGRLHRHERPRPSGFETPRCTVLIPDDDDYGYHGLIYGNTRVLWRTAQKLLSSGGQIVFPRAYRDWIEKVYQDDAWGDEPQSVLDSYNKFCEESDASYYTARQLMKSDVEEFSDTDSNVSMLTRDGEMSLNVLPVINTARGYKLLDEKTLVQDLDAWWKDEALNLNMVSVPCSWRKFLPDAKDGLVILPLRIEGERAIGNFKGMTIIYSQGYGLEKENSDGAA